MATLKRADGTVVPVPGRMVVGRSASCGLRLTDRAVSGEHAVLAWAEGAWTLRDLGSRNGTFVNGERVGPGIGRKVAVGDVLGFGTPAGFHLVDSGAPAPVAVAADGSIVTAVDGQLAFPSPDDPEVVIYQDARGRWVREHDASTEPITDGAALQAGGARWTVRVPAALEGTATIDAGPTLDTVQLVFAVSMDEEHVELSYEHRGKRTTLEAREHGYILLTLARARLADAELPLAEQGWLDRDRLLKMLGIDANAMNVGIYRARGQLQKAGLDGAAGIVEVRRGQRRFGVEPDRITVTSL